MYFLNTSGVRPNSTSWQLLFVVLVAQSTFLTQPCFSLGLFALKTSQPFPAISSYFTAANERVNDVAAHASKVWC